MQLNHPETIPRLWKNGLPQHQSLLSKGWPLLLYRAAVLYTRPSLALGSHIGWDVERGTKEELWGARHDIWMSEYLLLSWTTFPNDTYCEAFWSRTKRSLSSVWGSVTGSVSSVKEVEGTMVKAWSWADALSHELMIKWIQKYLKHLCIWMLAWAILCFQWDQEWVLVQQEGGRFEMRMYWFGEKTVFLSVRAPPRQILTCWKKEIIFPFRIKLFCGTFPGSVLSYPGPLKDRGYQVPGP